MIGLFDANGQRLSLTIETIVLNNEADPLDDRYEINSVRPSTPIDYVSDPKPEEDGLEVYRPRKVGRLLVVDGIIRANSIGRLYDKINTLAGKIDPVVLHDTYPTEEGFVPLDFTTPSVSGNLACRYYVRTNRAVEPIILDVAPRQEALFSLEFLLRDPRRYLQAETTLVGDGTATNSGNYKTWPTLQVDLTGAGSATFKIDNTTTGKSLTLDLSGQSAGAQVLVDMSRKRVTSNAVEAPGLVVAGDFFPLMPGGNSITYTNITNTTRTLKWRSAFAV